MTVEKSKGLSAQQLEALLKSLIEKAEKLKGEVMVFELANIVQVSFFKPTIKTYKMRI
jgi:hypothetical protein